MVPVGHVDVNGVSFYLPGRAGLLLDDVSFRVGEGAKVALVGANGAGKTTLLRIVAGDLDPHEGVDRPLRRPRASCASSSARCATPRRCATCCCRVAPPARACGGRGAGRRPSWR